RPQPEQVDAIHQLIQQTYALSVSSDIGNTMDLLPELVLDQMDEEQIWQQIELRNALMLPKFVQQAAQMMATREQDLGIELDDGNEENDTESLSEEETREENDEHQSELEEDSDGFPEPQKSSKCKSQQSKAKHGKKGGKRSVVDDTFFKLDEMKQFLEQEDAKEMWRQKNNKNAIDDSEGIDHFAEDFGVGEQTDEDDDDDNDGNVNYADFFDMDDELEAEAQKLPKDKARDFFNESETDQEDEKDEDVGETEQQSDEMESEIDEADFVAQSGVEPASDSDSDAELQQDEDENQAAKEKSKTVPQSSNEMREVRLLQRIRDYEDVVLGDKPWQLRGEVQAGNRPQNSLLEEILEFDSTTRPVAAITEEQNETIEDIIKQRIRDKAWDDVVRTVRPVHTPQEYRKQLVLDQEKSKQSLAQIYEQQYQQELQKLDPNRDADDSTTPEPKEHQEIKRAMRSLFLKLDALSNFHFTPKPVAPEIKIVTNTPAVHMEEVAPVAVSDAKLLAPEEVFRGPKHMPMGKTERTNTDKNRERRKKKQKQRAINSALEKRDLQRAKEGKAPTQREANAKLLKAVTKSRNVQKITSSNDQSALKSSKAFFNKLQDTTSTTASAGNKRPKKDTSKANAKKLKL
ncbi:hypothetical protein KR093_006267, partial [Drosophila rubida]